MPESVSAPLPTLVNPPLPPSVPAKTVSVPSVPTDSVALPSAMSPAPASEPRVMLLPPRSITAPAATVAAEPVPKALVEPASKVPAVTVVVPV